MSPSERFKKLTCTDPIRGDLRARSVRAASFTGAAGFADLALRMGSTAVLARVLLPEHFGVVMMVTAVTGIADQLRDMGLSTATVQKKEITHQEVSNLFWINTGLGLLIALLICVISPLISAYYRDPRLTLITCVLSSNFIFGGLMVQHQALLARTLRLGTSASVRLGSSVLSTALAIFLAWKGYGFWALIWRELVRSILLAAGMWLCLPWIPGLPSTQTDIRGLLKFGAHLSGANFFGSLSGGIDRFLLGRVWGAGPVGIYRQAYQLLIAPTDQLLSPIYQVTQPGLSMLQGDPVKFRRFYQKVLTVVCLVTMPLSLFVAVYSTEVVLVLLGSKWIECAPIFMILSFGAFIRQAVGSSAFILITRGRSKAYLGLSMVNNATLILFMLAGVKWGVLGVAVADVAVTWAMMWPRLHYSLKDSPVTIAAFLKTLARPTFASFGMALILVFLRMGIPGLSLVPSLSIGCLVAVGSFSVIWFLLPGGKAESLSLLSDLRSAIERKRVAVGPATTVVANP